MDTGQMEAPLGPVVRHRVLLLNEMRTAREWKDERLTSRRSGGIGKLGLFCGSAGDNGRENVYLIA